MAMFNDSCSPFYTFREDRKVSIDFNQVLAAQSEWSPPQILQKGMKRASALEFFLSAPISVNHLFPYTLEKYQALL